MRERPKKTRWAGAGIIRKFTARKRQINCTLSEEKEMNVVFSDPGRIQPTSPAAVLFLTPLENIPRLGESIQESIWKDRLYGGSMSNCLLSLQRDSNPGCNRDVTGEKHE
jgi:hypothetical protein